MNICAYFVHRVAARSDLSAAQPPPGPYFPRRIPAHFHAHSVPCVTRTPPYTFTFPDWDNWDNWDSLSNQWVRLSQFVPVARNNWDKMRKGRTQPDAAGPTAVKRTDHGAASHIAGSTR